MTTEKASKGPGQSFEGEAQSVVDAPPSKVRLKASLVTLRLTRDATGE